MVSAESGAQAGELAWGFTRVWSDPVIWPLVGAAVTLPITHASRPSG